jgi:hypothetical protein
MTQLGTVIAEHIVASHGPSEFLTRLSDPFWFQALGCVMGMDWHSSGITTSVMGALKRGLNPRSRDLGIYVCGGRGRYSRRTPDELRDYSGRTGSGEWAVIQQGMNSSSHLARRYHWHSAEVRDFTSNPHTAILGQPQGIILNLVDERASCAQQTLLNIVKEPVDSSLAEFRKLTMPGRHDVQPQDIDLKRLGAVLAVAHDQELRDFASLLLVEGLGPRTLQSLALIAEIVHGAASRFSDPARYTFAHGGKDGHPFPVPLKTYDETIAVLRRALNAAHLGHTEKREGFRRLDRLTRAVEEQCQPLADFSDAIAHEHAISASLDGRTVRDKDSHPPMKTRPSLQLSLFSD